MNSFDRQHVLVTKPWGYEHLIYQNATVGLWYLKIKKGQSTSLHCHPNKKTGLVVLSGVARMSFLNDQKIVMRLDKMILRPGLFHSTCAYYGSDVELLEIETPPQKDDLVRLSDAYGREGKPYEDYDKNVPTDLFYLAADGIDYTFANLQMRVQMMSSREEIAAIDGTTLAVILGGCLTAGPGKPVLSAADVVTGSTMSRLAAKFDVDNLHALLIARTHGKTK